VIPQKPFKKKRLYQWVEEAIGEAIVKGELVPGEILPNENDLCERYQVSRGVIREATKVLIKKGLVDSQPKTGTRVLDRAHWNLLDPEVLSWMVQSGQKGKILTAVTETRCIIESEAAKLAAQRGTDTEIEHINSTFEALAETLADESRYRYDRYLEKDLQFHMAILTAAHNELLTSIGSTMRDAILAARQMDRQELLVLRQSLPLHKAVADAISQRSAATAHSASWKMFEQVWQHLPK
jgi:DNA-binding FadR family transcriptional regulator